ncbi:AI-2E family transporter [Dictyobacter alpinus]|uniref:AI-2E family transporter n=1 Tax=Dictyobacter alpinus TaxID=2014873 RepID=A0A402B1W2_9CHLR|nr:AI-2E family transporter [Dictyobacter alpinus]GCE25318.1 AI-2E family transporter [Dictyobacter alpinus]
MSSVSNFNIVPKGDKNSTAAWTRRFLIALTIVAWMIILMGIWLVLSRILNALIIIGISALIAYVIYPLVRLLERFIPRPLAILLVYLGVLTMLLLLIYFVVLTAIGQLAALIVSIQKSLPDILNRLQPLISQITKTSISPNQLLASSEQVLNYLLSVAGNIFPLVNSIFLIAINIIIVTSLSVYFLLDGQHTVKWLREKTPLHLRAKIIFFLDTLHSTMGGFVRGQITLATVISAIMWLGYTIIGVPYVMLIAIIIFVFEFVPQIGSYISIGIAIALTLVTKGWQTALIVTIFSGIVQGGLDGQILAPRILGHSVGIHPIISIGALLIGADLFGLLGALFAAPIAGIIQIIILTYWRSWTKRHPEEFPEEIADQLPVLPLSANRTIPGIEQT